MYYPALDFTFFGIISLFVSYFVIALALYFKGHKSIENDHIYIILYSNFAVIVYLLSRNIVPIIIGGAYHRFFYSNIQDAIATIGISQICQFICLLLINKSFNRVLVIILVQFASLFLIQIFIGFGIINLVWFFIFSASTGGLLTMNDIIRHIEFKIDNILQKNLPKEEIKDYYQDLGMYTKIVLQVFLALGASLGVSLSILFKDGNTIWDNNDYLSSAFSMVISFVLISLGLVMWILKPYLNIYYKIR
jgi:hypothetical protein